MAWLRIYSNIASCKKQLIKTIVKVYQILSIRQLTIHNYDLLTLPVIFPVINRFRKKTETKNETMHRSACVGYKSRVTNIALARLRYAGILSPGSHLEDEDGTYFAAERALTYQG